MDEKTRKLTHHFSEIIKLLDPEPSRASLTKTPERAAKAFRFLTSGHDEDIQEIINGALFESDNNGMVVVKDIEFYSTCEHHIMPFHGVAHVGYLPEGHVIGLSKIPRIVDHFARRLQIQENLTLQVAHSLSKILATANVAVLIKAKHSCMCMRGVGKQNAFMISSTMLGAFLSNSSSREEFFRLTQES